MERTSSETLEGQQIFKQQEGFSNKGLSEEKVGLNLD
jgi:hypothetical protein